MRLLWLAALLMLSSCASAPVGMNSSVQVLDGSDLPAPGREDQFASNRPYLIGAFDKLKIDVFGVEDLQKEVQTDANGRFSFPLIGVVEGMARTPTELQREIELRMSRFVRNPQVTVNLVETVSQVVTVEGEVKKPGLYPVLGNMTLLRTVAVAGGVGELASIDDVVVFRKVDGQRYAALYNLKAIRRGNYEDPEIYPNDVVVVGESNGRRLFRDLLAASPLLTTPLIILTNGN